MRHDEVERLEAALRSANPWPRAVDLGDSEEVGAVRRLVDDQRHNRGAAPVVGVPQSNGGSPYRRWSRVGAFAGGFAVMLLVVAAGAMFLPGGTVPVADEPVTSSTVGDAESATTAVDTSEAAATAVGEAVVAPGSRRDAQAAYRDDDASAPVHDDDSVVSVPFHDDDSDDDSVAPDYPNDRVVSVEPVEYVAADAGSVWIGFDGYYLFFDEVMVNEGWGVFKQDVSPDQVIVEFHSCDTKVEFKAQVDGSQVKLEVKSSPR